MQNPWTKISWNNTVADCDRRIISPVYCAEMGIDISNLPEPYTGNINSNVVCLNLNPGIGKCDACFRYDMNFLKLTRDTLCHRIDHSMWLDYIRCKHGGLHEGCEWWQKRTAYLQKTLSDNPLNMFVLEYFPYHTKQAFRFPSLPSDEYRNELLSNAIKDKKLIVIMRGKKYWNSIPGVGLNLIRYTNKIVISNPRNVYFTPGNLGTNFNRLVTELMKPVSLKYRKIKII